MPSLLWRAVLALTLIATAMVGTAAPAFSTSAPVAQPATVAQPVKWWTEPASTSVFKDSEPTLGSGRAMSLDTARNEFESAQVVLRTSADLKIRRVDFTTLRRGASTIASSNLSYNFVDYQYLDANTHDSANGKMDIYPGVRVGPGLYPDRLTNERSKSVAARSTQSIWVRAYVPSSAAAGVYSGTISVVTDKGTIAVPMSVNVRAVTLPASKDGAFTTALWQLFTGNISWDEGRGETIELPDVGYGYPLYSRQWWELMANVARMMKEYRTNSLELPVIKLLAHSGSMPNGQNGYDFDWTRFDQIVEFMMSAGAVKRLEGFPEPAFTSFAGGGDGIRDIQVIRNVAGKPSLTWVNWTSPEGQNWLTHYLPALRDHLRTKGWLDIFWTHAGDEPQPGDVDDYLRLAQRMRQIWPGIRLGDAVDRAGVHPQIIGLNHQAVVQEHVYDADMPFYDQLVADGKEVWLYNSTAPRGNHLNRFIDQPQWYQRMTIWYAYSRGLHGYLHWAMNDWQYSMDAQDAKGDGLIVRPDKVRNTVEVTPRYESLRDGIEDYELLTLLGQRDAGLARGLAASLVQRSDKFTPDVAYMQRVRALALDAAAGGAIDPDIARGATVAASTGNPVLAVDGNPSTAWQAEPGGWIQVDLGRQVQVDVVRLRWNTAYGKDYRIQLSYDGTRWTDGNVITGGDGGTDLVGVNGKARHLRLEVTAGSSPYALTDLEVSGSPLAKENVLGGRDYLVTPAPGDKPDSGFESTDGALADAYDDGRTYGFAPGQTHADVVFDLGRDETVDSARVHAYEEYPGYRPNQVTVLTSTDGVTYKQKGSLSGTNDQSRIWYEFQFPPSTARYVKVSFDKTYTADDTVMLIDEIEAYGPGDDGISNVAEGRKYTKSAEPDDPFYPDSQDRESTDGEIGGSYTDGRSYGYYLDPGETRSIAVTVDLDGPKAARAVRVKQYVDGVHDYAPDRVAVWVKPVGGDFRPVAEVTLARGGWYDVGFEEQLVTAVRIEATKREGSFADYLFLDEIAVLGDLSRSPANLVAGSTYQRTTAELDPSYPDSTGTESTDGVLAGSFDDGLSWAYHLRPGQTLTADIDFDLGAARSLSITRFRQYFDGEHNYAPDKVTVLTSDDGATYTERAVVTEPTDRWFEAGLNEVSARYVKFRATKTYSDFADYIFVDELQVLGTP